MRAPMMTDATVGRVSNQLMAICGTDLPVSPGHPFYAKLNAILDEAGFDRFAEAECQQFYAPVMGRPSLPPGRYFRLLLVGYLKGSIPSAASRGVPRTRWPCAASWGSASTRRRQITPRFRAPGD